MTFSTPVKQKLLQNYTNEFSAILHKTRITTSYQEIQSTQTAIENILTIFLHCREKKGTVYIIGNGGSAAIASHAVIDFMNMAKMRAMSMLDPAVTTCFSNDYGYEQVYVKQLMPFIQKDDVLVAISSSGQSQNIIQAVSLAKNREASVITLSGFLENNPLRNMGHYNVWLNSKDYGHVEIGHAFILHYLTDRLRDYDEGEK